MVLAVSMLLSDDDSRPDFERRRDFRAIWVVAGVFGRAFQRRTIVPGHTCPIPLHGPAVIAANHTSGLDPIMIQSTCPRLITWVMTAEFYDLPSLNWFLKYVKMIRIDRTTRDTSAWKLALEALGRNQVVGVFPEGRIARTRDLLPFEDGVSTMASRGGSDIYPVYLDGLQRSTPMLDAYLTPQHPLVAWGRKVPIRTADDKRRKPREITAELKGRIDGLRQTHVGPRMKGRSLIA
jgi:1-acyl-sn-glycerol-3-phosphate acyltransferase